MSIRELVQEIPDEIRRAINALDNDTRAAIFVLLLKNKELSFSGLKRELNLPKARLNYHLRKLAESALVQHFFKHALGEPEYSFYSVSPFGINFVGALNQSLQPEPPSWLKQPEGRLDSTSTFKEGFVIVLNEKVLTDFECDILNRIDARKWIGTCVTGIRTSSENASDVTHPSTLFRERESLSGKGIVRA